MAILGRQFGRRTIALFWCAVVAVVSGVLISLEMIPVLYVLATLSLVILLMVVAFADLESVGHDLAE